MLGTEFVFSSLVSQLFETKNSGFPCASAILWLCSSTSRTVIPKRARNSLSVLPGCIDCLSRDNTAVKAQVDTPIAGRTAACALGEDSFCRAANRKQESVFYQETERPRQYRGVTLRR